MDNQVAGISELITREALLWNVWQTDGNIQAWENWKTAHRAMRDAIKALPKSERPAERAIV